MLVSGRSSTGFSSGTDFIACCAGSLTDPGTCRLSRLRGAARKVAAYVVREFADIFSQRIEVCADIVNFLGVVACCHFSYSFWSLGCRTHVCIIRQRNG
jgi:hypothetical protein